MWGWVEKIFQGLVTGLVGPLFNYLGKRQDDTLAGFQTATGADTVAYQAWLQYQVQIGAQKAVANSWWGAKLLYMIVGGAAALHTAAVFLDSTVRLGCGHYGCLGVPPLPTTPTDYASYERMIVYSLFVVSTIGPPASAATAWLHKSSGSYGGGRPPHHRLCKPQPRASVRSRSPERHMTQFALAVGSWTKIASASSTVEVQRQTGALRIAMSTGAPTSLIDSEILFERDAFRQFDAPLPLDLYACASYAGASVEVMPIGTISGGGGGGTGGRAANPYSGSDYAKDGADITAATIPAGGSGIRGWLSTIANALQGTLKVSWTGQTVGVSNFPSTQPISGAVTANLGTLNGAALDASLQSILTTLQAQRSESLWTEDTNAFFVRVEKAGALTWTDGSGNASAAPGTGARPAAGTSAIVDSTRYKATAAGSGYSVGDYLSHIVTTDPSTGRRSGTSG